MRIREGEEGLLEIRVFRDTEYTNAVQLEVRAAKLKFTVGETQLEVRTGTGTAKPPFSWIGFQNGAEPSQLEQKTDTFKTDTIKPSISLFILRQGLWKYVDSDLKLSNTIVGDVEVEIEVSTGRVFAGHGKSRHLGQPVTYKPTLIGIGLRKPPSYNATIWPQYIPRRPVIGLDGQKQIDHLINERGPTEAGDLQITIHEEARYRFRREVLFGFEVVADSPGPLRPTSVRTTILGAFRPLAMQNPTEAGEGGGDAPNASVHGLFLAAESPPLILCEISVEDNGENWRLRPLRRISIASTRPTVHYQLDHVLKVGCQYAVCIELNEVRFNVRDYFSTFNSFRIEVGCHVKPTLPPNKIVARVALEHSSGSYLLISASSADRAVVLPSSGGWEEGTAGVVISRREKTEFLIQNIGDSSIFLYAGFESDADLIGVPAYGLFVVKEFVPSFADDFFYVLTDNLTSKLFYRLVEQGPEQIFGIDIGTMATAVAVVRAGRVQVANIGDKLRDRIAEFGETLADRRESEEGDFISAACGISLADPQGFVTPAQFGFEIGGRRRRHTEIRDPVRDMLERAQSSGLPIDFHAPLLDREHELDPAVYGMVALPSVKLAACSGATIPPILLGRNGGLRVFWTETSGAAVGGKPIAEVPTEILLEAAIDAVINTYLIHWDPEVYADTN